MSIVCVVFAEFCIPFILCELVGTSEDKDPRALMVDLSRKLPDISSFDDIPSDLARYGRCAILRDDGGFWFAETLSIHPATTVEGFYWGLSGNTLYLSPRGAAFNWEKFITDDFARFIAKKAGLKRRFTKFKLINAKEKLEGIRGTGVSGCRSAVSGL